MNTPVDELNTAAASVTAAIRDIQTTLTDILAALANVRPKIDALAAVTDGALSTASQQKAQIDSTLADVMSKLALLSASPAS